MNQTDASRDTRQPDQAAPSTADVPLVSSDVLLGGRRELHIVHGQEVYRLMLTRNNKLILQK
jgi:hemin uptake protein HemP